jgi:hypothetical protein
MCNLTARLLSAQVTPQRFLDLFARFGEQVPRREVHGAEANYEVTVNASFLATRLDRATIISRHVQTDYFRMFGSKYARTHARVRRSVAFGNCWPAPRALRDRRTTTTSDATLLATRRDFELNRSATIEVRGGDVSGAMFVADWTLPDWARWQNSVAARPVPISVSLQTLPDFVRTVVSPALFIELAKAYDFVMSAKSNNTALCDCPVSDVSALGTPTIAPTSEPTSADFSAGGDASVPFAEFLGSPVASGNGSRTPAARLDIAQTWASGLREVRGVVDEGAGGPVFNVNSTGTRLLDVGGRIVAAPRWTLVTMNTAFEGQEDSTKVVRDLASVTIQEQRTVKKRSFRKTKGARVSRSAM